MSVNSHENKIWMKKLVKSSSHYLKLKSKLEKEKQMNKMLLEHLMSLRLMERDIENILELCRNSSQRGGDKHASQQTEFKDVHIKIESGTNSCSRLIRKAPTVVIDDSDEECEFDDAQVVAAPVNVNNDSMKVADNNDRNVISDISEAAEVVEVEDISEAADAAEVVEEEVVEDISEAADAAEVVEEEEVVEVEEEEEVVEEEEEVEDISVAAEVVEEEAADISVAAEESADVFEVEYDGQRYYTTDENNGAVYAVLEDDDIGDQIGNFVNGELVLL